MPITSTQLGARYELKAVHELEADDYQVERARGKVLWIPDKRRPGRRIPITKRVDFFGAFDLIAASADDLRFIQIHAVSTREASKAAEKKQRIEAAARFLPIEVSLELWQWQLRRPASEGNRVPNGWTKLRLERGVRNGAWRTSWGWG